MWISTHDKIIPLTPTFPYAIYQCLSPLGGFALLCTANKRLGVTIKMRTTGPRCLIWVTNVGQLAKHRSQCVLDKIHSHTLTGVNETYNPCDLVWGGSYNTATDDLAQGADTSTPIALALFRRYISATTSGGLIFMQGSVFGGDEESPNSPVQATSSRYRKCQYISLLHCASARSLAWQMGNIFSAKFYLFGDITSLKTGHFVVLNLFYVMKHSFSSIIIFHINVYGQGIRHYQLAMVWYSRCLWSSWYSLW